MTRWLVVIGVVLLVAILATGIYVYAALSQSAVAGPFARTANPQVLWGGGESRITLAENLTDLPTCAPTQRAADIVLLIDKSSSMDGEPFQQAQSAVEAFVQNLDLNVNQAAIIYFNETANLAQPLTADRAVLLETIQKGTASGETDIGQALLAARLELSSPRRQRTATPVVILLSDGGAQDQDKAVETAKTLKNVGVRIVTIGLPSAQFAPDTMRTIASRASDAYISPTPSELSSIYQVLAEQINRGIATNLIIQENPNLAVFQIEPSSATPTAQINADSLTWEVSVLTQPAAKYEYRLSTKQWGMYSASVNPGQSSLLDCNGSTQNAILPTGPNILVMPPPIFCLLPLAALALVPFFAFLWRRRREQPEPVSIDISRPEEAPIPDDTPAWLARLGDKHLALVPQAPIVEPTELQNTVLIGCGPAGRIVLSQIAQQLKTRFGGAIPGNVRLLQIDVQLSSDTGEPPPVPAGLEPQQRVLLRPNLKEITDNLASNRAAWAHLWWYEGAGPTYERAKGRAALFYDLRNGIANSELERGLQLALYGLQAPRVRVIGSTFDDVSSGMLVDLARQVQIISRTRLDVELWLATAQNVEWAERLDDKRRLRLPEQRTRSLATVRELERFERNTPVPFIYVPPSNQAGELRAVSGGIVQSLFLFESLPQSGNVKPENDVLVAMADALLALLHREVNAAMNEHLQARRANVGQKINRDGLGMASAIGSYSFFLPGEALTRGLAWRMVRDMLYDQKAGITPRLATLSDGEYRKLEEDEQEASARANLLELRADAQTLVQKHAVSPYGLDSNAFTMALRARVLGFLNGEGVSRAEPVLGRNNGLLRARYWLDAVRGFVNQESAPPQVSNRVNALRQALEDWETWLSSSVLDAGQARWQAARGELEKLLQQSARNWLLDKQLEWTAYREQIRPWDEKPAEGSDDYLLRASRRFGWELKYRGDNQWRLRLIVPPANWVWAEGANVDGYAVSRQDAPEILLQRLYGLAEPFVRLTDKTLLLIKQAEAYRASQWHDKAAPRLDFDELAAAEEMGAVRKVTLLVVPNTFSTDSLAHNLESASSHGNAPRVTVQRDEPTGLGAQTFKVFRVGDATCITLLRIVDWIPLKVTSQFGNAAWQSENVPPQMYVWQAEQSAAREEGNGETLYNEMREGYYAQVSSSGYDQEPVTVAPFGGELFSPRFVSWLALDADLVRWFGLAYLFQLMQETPDGYALPGVGGIGEGAPGQLLEHLIEQPPETLGGAQRAATFIVLKNALEQERARIVTLPEMDLRTYLREMSESLVKPLLQSRDSRDQDFARYLLSLIATEK